MVVALMSALMQNCCFCQVMKHSFLGFLLLGDLHLHLRCAVQAVECSYDQCH